MEVCAHTRQLTYSEALAYALTVYADHVPDFAHTLHALIPTNDETLPAPKMPKNDLSCLMPHDTDTALRRALWLTDVINTKRLPGHREALAILTESCQRRAYEYPKDLPFLLGVVVGVVPMVGMGHVHIKKEPLHIIVRSDTWRRMDDIEQTRALITLPINVISRALELAHGRTAYLEPEMGDWLFGDRSVALLTCTEDVLQDTHAHLSSLGTPYADRSDDHGVSMLAISPTVYVRDLPRGEELVALE